MTRQPEDHSAAFPPTRLSILARIGSGEPEVRREAFGALAEAYWKPIYKYLRIRWSASREEAEDLTQGFLSRAFEKRYLEGFDPGIARFRTFLRTCLDRFVMNERKAASRIKRGGSVALVSFDFPTAESELNRREPGEPSDVDELFRTELIRELFERTVCQVREEMERRGKARHFTLFERYDLDPESGLTYARLAEQFDLSVTQVTNHLASVRRAFRDRVLVNLREISGSDEEFRAEARELFGIEVDAKSERSQ